ncbi:hypothetical protein [Streptomyces sp. NPDC050485]|uniref:hypothetical protein n=1 Tax=Streptomyces sp. NPDC050485 TaxID=3365617 RepID=UPI0037A1C052
MAMPEIPERDVKAVSGRYRLLLGVAVVAGCLTLAGWIWALWLALVPIGEPLVSKPNLSCGSPALFDESAFADSNGFRGDGKYWAGQCAEKVSSHVRGAVGISVVTAPLSVLWIWSALSLPRERAMTEAESAS